MCFILQDSALVVGFLAKTCFLFYSRIHINNSVQQQKVKIQAEMWCKEEMEAEIPSITPTVERENFFPHISKFKVYTCTNKQRLFRKENDKLGSRNYKCFRTEIAAFMSSLCVAVLTICSAFSVQFTFFLQDCRGLICRGYL